MERFADFLDAHVEVGLGTIPTFIVGHMSGDNWDPPWRGGAGLVPRCVAGRPAGLVRRADRAPLRRPPRRRRAGSIQRDADLRRRGQRRGLTSWARLVVQAVRAGGCRKPVSLGDGAWGIEVSGNDNGYSLRAPRPLVDFIGPHVYPTVGRPGAPVDERRPSPALCSVVRPPVILEEFGLSSDFVSDETAPTTTARCCTRACSPAPAGWIAWNNCDYDDLRGPGPVPAPSLRDALRAHRPVGRRRSPSSARSPGSRASSPS